MMTVNIATLSVSQHVREHRWTRITECVKAVGGIGEVVYTCPSIKAKYPGQVVVNCVTSTGLVFVVNVTKNSLITGYLGTVRGIQGLYQAKLPDDLFITVRRNERRYSYLYSIME